MREHIVERQIMWGDLDALGIVFYPRMYEWMDGCSHLFLDAAGVNQERLRSDRRLIFGLSETACRYVVPGRYHQRIRIVTRLGSLEEKTLELHHRILNAGDDSPMAEGREKRICMDVSDPARVRAAVIPPDIHGMLAANMV